MKPGKSIELRGRWALLGVWVFALGWSAVVYFIDDYLLGRAVKQFQTGSYPSVEGTVLSCAAREVPTEHGTSHRVDIEYTYRVDNQVRTARRVDYRILARSASQVTEFVGAHAPGSKITVFFDPEDPTRAVLTPGFTEQGLLMLLFAFPFNMIALLLLGLAVVCTRGEEDMARLSSGIRIMDRPDETRIRLPRCPPALATLVFLTACSVPAVFLGLCGAIISSVACTTTVWILLIGSAAVFYLRLAWRVVSGKTDLVINRIESRLQLPRTFGRKQAIVVQFADVAAIDVVTKKQEGTEEDRYTHAVTLRWRDADGQMQEGKLAEWGDKPPAERLAALILSKIGGRPGPATASATQGHGTQEC
jgi:hypothetical protein